MDERIKRIKEKLKSSKSKPFSKEFDDFFAGIEEQIGEEVKRSAAGKIVEDVQSVLHEVRKLMEHRDQGFRDITAYLEFTRQEMERNTEKQHSIVFDVVEGLEKIAKSMRDTQKVSVTNASKLKMTKTEMKAAFSEALQSVEKLLVSQNVIAGRGDVTYDRNRNPVIIEEDYGDYVLKTELRYDQFGNITSWQTNKI